MRKKEKKKKEAGEWSQDEEEQKTKGIFIENFYIQSNMK